MKNLLKNLKSNAFVELPSSSYTEETPFAYRIVDVFHSINVHTGAVKIKNKTFSSWILKPAVVQTRLASAR